LRLQVTVDGAEGALQMKYRQWTGLANRDLRRRFAAYWSRWNICTRRSCPAVAIGSNL